MLTRLASICALAALAGAAPAAAQPQAVPWAEVQPTDADYMATYPIPALAQDLEGAVQLLCTITEARKLDCTVHSEAPQGAGFGAAALRLSQLYVVRADDPRVAVGRRVLIPIRYVLLD